MAKYSEAVIEEIKAKLSLVDVVSRYLALQRKGDRYWGLCPFHTEKTPSFSVLPDKGFFHCFGCGKSGSLFDFVMEMEHLSFPEAVKLLAQQAHVELTEETEAQKRRHVENDALSELYNKIAASFHYILMHSNAAENARQYLLKRKITTGSWEKFLLGYAPGDPQWLYDFLIAKHYSEDLLAKSGLFSRNKARYPLFRNRLMFPIRSWQGKVLAFGARALDDFAQPKYINTPETAIYHKREVVYGLYESLPVVKEKESCILCEGYLDVIALHQAGVHTAMAPLGTAFTHEQGKLIRRYAKVAHTLFDNDKAGQTATRKALVLCESLGFETRVITLSNAKDPAQLLEQSGEQALTNACATSDGAFHYLVQSALNLYDKNKATGKLQIFQEVKPYLDTIDSEIVQQSYLRDLAELLEIDEASLLRDYMHAASEQQAPEEQRAKRYSLDRWKRSVDLYAMLTLINNRALFPTVRAKLRLDDLADEQAQELYTVLEDTVREGVGATDEVILAMINDEQLRQIVSMSFQTEEFQKRPQEILEEAMYRISLRNLEKRRKQVESLLRLAERDGSSPTELSHLILEKQSLDETITNMRK